MKQSPYQRLSYHSRDGYTHGRRACADAEHAAADVRPIPTGTDVFLRRTAEKAHIRSGRLVTIDGAGGVGKSTTVTSMVEYLQKLGTAVRATSQPSRTPLGAHIRGHVDQYSGIALVCLVAGDRHHQQDAEIVPALDAGHVVICDRYLPSSLVLQSLFVYGSGVVNVMWTVDGGNWQGPVGLTQPNTALAGSQIALHHQGSEHQLDAMFVDDSGVVNVMWAVDGGNWQGPVGMS